MPPPREKRYGHHYDYTDNAAADAKLAARADTATINDIAATAASCHSHNQ